MKFTLDRKNARCLGVCSGIAKYLNTDVGVVRLLAVLGVIFTGPVVAVAYLVAGLVLPEADD